MSSRQYFLEEHLVIFSIGQLNLLLDETWAMLVLRIFDIVARNALQVQAEVISPAVSWVRTAAATGAISQSASWCLFWHTPLWASMTPLTFGVWRGGFIPLSKLYVKKLYAMQCLTIIQLTHQRKGEHTAVMVVNCSPHLPLYISLTTWKRRKQSKTKQLESSTSISTNYSNNTLSTETSILY